MRKKKGRRRVRGLQEGQKDFFRIFFQRFIIYRLKEEKKKEEKDFEL